MGTILSRVFLQYLRGAKTIRAAIGCEDAVLLHADNGAGVSDDKPVEIGGLAINCCPEIGEGAP